MKNLGDIAMVLNTHLKADIEEIVLAGGCFWCVGDLEKLPGVITIVLE